MCVCVGGGGYLQLGGVNMLKNVSQGTTLVLAGFPVTR